jgi:hypothetical protein
MSHPLSGEALKTGAKLTSFGTGRYNSLTKMFQNSKFHLRMQVIATALALAISWLSAPLSMAAMEPDVCEMECCVAEGHCCCAARRPFVKGHEPKPGQISWTVESSMTAPCPASCSGATSSPLNLSPRLIDAHTPLVVLGYLPLAHAPDPTEIPHVDNAQPSSPRAPPAVARLAV